MNIRQRIETVNNLDDFYTPSDTASVLANWSVRTGDEVILEPSAGAGSLVISSLEKAKQITGGMSCKVLAFDVDERAIEKLEEIQFPGLLVKKRDFLNTSSDDYFSVDAVIANPPFRRNHKIEKDERKRLRERFDTKGAIGIWGHFFLHSLSYLKTGGRVACIVPRSVLFTDHGDYFMKKACSFFSSIGVYEFLDRPIWSKRADEMGAVIFADGYNCGVSQSYERGFVDSKGNIEVGSYDNSFPYKEMERFAIGLGNIAEVSIGTVTGRNKVFLLSEDEALESRISEDDLLPIVSRSKHLSGLKLNELELANLGARGEKTWLLYPDKFDGKVEKYLSSRLTEDDIANTVWFQKRKPWWKVQVSKSCDAMLTYMNHSFPRLAMIEGEIHCTNTLHKIVYSEKASNFLVNSSLLTPLSTFGQLWSEKNGRTYGGGMLKLELSEARKLPVINKPYEIFSNLLSQVDQCLRTGESDSARKLVDAAIMPAIFGSQWEGAQNELYDELIELRGTRKGGV